MRRTLSKISQGADRDAKTATWLVVVLTKALNYHCLVVIYKHVPVFYLSDTQAPSKNPRSHPIQSCCCTTDVRDKT